MRSTAPERPQRARRDDDPGRLARWRQGWALALRLARRDIRTHRARSVLIMVLVGAPVLLIAALATAAATNDVSAREELPARLGHAQAEIRAVESGPVEQIPAGEYAPTGAAYVPFGDRRAEEPWTADQLQALTGGRIVPVGRPTLFATRDGRLTRLTTLAVTAPDLPDTGLATLSSGRWPSGADEVLVTERGRERGLPDQGTLAVRRADDPTERPVRVVGVASVPDLSYSAHDLVSVGPADVAAEGPWLVLRDRPVEWAEVKRWNAHGLVVFSRAAIENPPPRSELPPDLVYPDRANAGAVYGLAVLVTVGLLLETSLLAGPAFAVSAVRRRRTLAQLAGNGADRGQLTRTVLAEALLLGAGAAVLGVVLGAGGGLGVLALIDRSNPLRVFGPLDLPWLALVGLVLAATTAALVSAIVPARGASRIAIADVLAGRERSHPIRRTAPAIGLVLVLVAAGTLVATVLLGWTSDVLWLDGLAAAALVIGTLLLVPALLVGLGRWAPRLPLTLRLPVRDAGRQRGRAASAVAAVVATVATLTLLGVANASDDAHNRSTYLTDRVDGHGYLLAEPGIPVEPSMDEIRQQHPDWLLLPRRTLGTVGYAGSGREPTTAVIVPPGCTPAVALGIGEVSEADYERCTRYHSGTVQVVGSEVVAGSTASAELRASLEGGDVLVRDSALLTDGRITVAIGTATGSPSDGVDRLVTVSAAVVPQHDLYAAARLPLPRPTVAGTSPYQAAPLSGLLTTSTADRLKLPTTLDQIEVIDPAGPISPRDEAAVNDRVLSSLQVERGYESQLGALLGALLGVAGTLVLVAALVATALAGEESRADLATLAAVGGPAGLRRRLAANSALVVAGLGSLLGFAAGLLPGIVFGLAFTTDYAGYDPATGEPIGTGDGVLVVPWLPLLAVLVGVPLLAALVSALTVRRDPGLTRRLT